MKSGVVDWNCNRLLDGTVGSDVNDDGTLTGSTSINDWNALVYDGGAVGSPAGTVTLPATTAEIEQPIDVLERSAAALDGELLPAPAVPPTATIPAAPKPPPAKKCKKGFKRVKGKCRKKKRKK